MRLNGDDIQDYIFPLFCFNKQTVFNDFRIDIPSHYYKRFSTGTRWIYKRVIPYKYSRSDLSKQRTDHPFNQDPKYKNLGIYGLPKRDNRRFR